MEGRLGRVEEIPGVKRAVPDVFKRASVKTLGTGGRGSANDSSRRAPELRRVVARKNRELLDSVGPEIDPQGTPRRAIHVVIDADTVQAGAVLPLAAPGHCHLVTETPLCLSRGFRAPACSPRSKRTQTSPTPPHSRHT